MKIPTNVIGAIIGAIALVTAAVISARCSAPAQKPTPILPSSHQPKEPRWIILTPGGATLQEDQIYPVSGMGWIWVRGLQSQARARATITIAVKKEDLKSEMALSKTFEPLDPDEEFDLAGGHYKIEATEFKRPDKLDPQAEWNHVLVMVSKMSTR